SPRSLIRAGWTRMFISRLPPNFLSKSYRVLQHPAKAAAAAKARSAPGSLHLIAVGWNLYDPDLIATSPLRPELEALLVPANPTTLSRAREGRVSDGDALIRGERTKHRRN